MTLLPFPCGRAIVILGYNHAYADGLQIKKLHLVPLGALKTSQDGVHQRCLWCTKLTAASIKGARVIWNVGSNGWKSKSNVYVYQIVIRLVLYFDVV